MNTMINSLNLNIKLQDIENVVEMLDTAIDATIELINLYNNQNYNIFVQVLGDLDNMMKSLESITEFLADERKHSLLQELLENVQDTILDINTLVEAKYDEKVLVKIEFQLLPFVRNLRESFYFWGLVYPNKEKMDNYYLNEFAGCFSNLYIQSGEELPYKLSIVVTGYNHLDVTKRCIEQLLKVTDFEKLNAELILMDHGSTDGTLEYFESLNIGKVIHFKKNVRMYWLTTLYQVCRSKYFVFVSNDVLVTNNWADILLKCLDSDDNIIAAVPTTPNICNLQMLQVPTNDPDEFIEWAEKNNASEPSKWNDRARIMPPLCSYNTVLVNNIGFADPLFYSMEFWDDDFSLRARRMGYRQIVCDDVACYHFGSVTCKEFQKKEGTLEYGRDLFKQKHNVDAWGKGFCYDIRIISMLKEYVNFDKEVNILGIDCGFGDTFLQLKNEMRHRKKVGNLYCINSQPKYNDDLNSVCDKVENVDSIISKLEEYEENIKFDAIWIESSLVEYENLDLVFEKVIKVLDQDGCFIGHCNNPYDVLTINRLMNFEIKDEKIVLASPNNIINIAKKYFSRIQVKKVCRSVSGINDFIDLYYANAKNKKQIEENLSIERYYFVLKR